MRKVTLFGGVFKESKEMEISENANKIYVPVLYDGEIKGIAYFELSNTGLFYPKAEQNDQEILDYYQMN